MVGRSRLPRPGRQQPRPWALPKRSIKTQEIVRALLEHLGEPATPPRIASARGPPAWYEDAGSASHWEDDSAVPGDPLAQPESEYEFDQRVTW